MRYFIYAKTDEYKNFHPISFTSNGFYIELNNLYASMFTDNENDFPEIPKIEKAKELINKLKNAFKDYKFEIRTTKGEKYE